MANLYEGNNNLLIPYSWQEIPKISPEIGKQFPSYQS